MKEYKTRHDWVSKVILWELCKKLKFDHTNKWYMHSPESVRENKTHKLLWDFDIQTDHLISTRRPDLIIINNKERTCRIVDFAVPADYGAKLKEIEKRDKYFDLAKELKKLWHMKVTIIPIVIGALSTVTKIGTRTGGLGDCPNYDIFEILQDSSLYSDRSPLHQNIVRGVLVYGQ